MLNDLDCINDRNLLSCFNNDDEDLSILNFLGGTEVGHLGPSYINNDLALDFTRRTSNIESTPSLSSGSSIASLPLPSPLTPPISRTRESSDKLLHESIDDIFEFIELQYLKDDEDWMPDIGNLKDSESLVLGSSIEPVCPSTVHEGSNHAYFNPSSSSTQPETYTSVEFNSILDSLFSESKTDEANVNVNSGLNPKWLKLQQNSEEHPTSIDNPEAILKGESRKRRLKDEYRNSKFAKHEDFSKQFVCPSEKKFNKAKSNKKGRKKIPEDVSECDKKFLCNMLLKSKEDGTISRCDKGFTRRHDLKRHERTVHRPRHDDLICDGCGLEFTRPDALGRHLSLKQSECSPYHRRKKRCRTFDLTIALNSDF